MIPRCVRCGLEEPDALTPEGLCFECDQGNQDARPSKENMKELAESIVDGLARKTGSDRFGVAQEMATSSYVDKMAEQRAYPNPSGSKKNPPN